MSGFSTPDEINRDHECLKSTFASGRTKDLAWRRWQLKQLWWLVADNEEALISALKKDLNRHPFESTAADISGVKKEILDHLRHLDEWTSTKPVDGAGFLFNTLGGARLRKQPLGVTLIIGPWNFPLLLILQPLVAAIGAGCCAMLKPSELSENCTILLQDLVPRYLDQSAIRVVTGGPQETSHILALRFDHIFFTGSSKVARFITAAAAKHLTPVVLELGGQGPCIVTKSANINLAARRITSAKFTNAGQICLSVNHVFVEPEVAEELVGRMRYWNAQYLSQGNEGMSRIINERNYDRLADMLERTNGTVVDGGRRDRAGRYIEPTIVDGVTLDDALMADEIFGPILPIIRASPQEAVQIINSMPSPLALYIFAKDKALTDWIIENTLTGGVTVNNVFFHANVPNAPFGGVGEAGYGFYHGPYGIDCFSHKRTIVQPPSWIDKLMAFTYPPYDVKYVKWLTVKNSIGFKRGETLEDQRQRKGSLGKGLVYCAVGAGVLGLVVAHFSSWN
ncbi:hypothetical protein BDV12DRAFT_180848 [Aspergillus spectabilis]